MTAGFNSVYWPGRNHRHCEKGFFSRQPAPTFRGSNLSGKNRWQERLLGRTSSQ